MAITKKERESLMKEASAMFQGQLEEERKKTDEALAKAEEANKELELSKGEVTSLQNSLTRRATTKIPDLRENQFSAFLIEKEAGLSRDGNKIPPVLEGIYTSTTGHVRICLEHEGTAYEGVAELYCKVGRSKNGTAYVNGFIRDMVQTEGKLTVKPSAFSNDRNFTVPVSF